MSGHNLLQQLAFQSDHEEQSPASGTAISVTKSGHFSFATGASGETNTLANPSRAGIEIVFNCYSHGGGNRVITAASLINSDGNTVMTFEADPATIGLKSVRRSATAFGWVVVHNNNVTLS